MKARSTAKPEHSRHYGSSDRGGRGQGLQATAVADSRPEMEQQQDLLSLMAGSPRLQRKCACGAPSVAGGSCAGCEAKENSASSLVLQKKLAIGAADDPLEREADRVADQVILPQAPKALLGSVARPRIQRHGVEQRSVTGLAAIPASVTSTLAMGGRRLHPMLRQEMEQRFSWNFEAVRIHTDDQAARSARDIQAHAYTVGQHVVFGENQFRPGTQPGARLLAHELAHVIQQSGSSPRLQREEATPKAANADEAMGLLESGLINTFATVASVSSPLLESLFKGGLIGFYAELRQVIRSDKAEELWERFKQLLKSPSDVLALYNGYLWGVLQGLWSPIQGFIDLFKFGLAIQQWQLEVLRNILDNVEELILMKSSLSERFSRIGLKIQAFFQEKKTNVADFLHALISAVKGGLFELAKKGGHKAGQAMLRFTNKPWGEIGEGVGVVVGSVLIEVILAVFSEGIANVAAKIGQVFGRVAPTLMKGVRFIAIELRAVVAELHLLFESLKQGLAKAGGSLLRGLEGIGAEVGGLLDDVVAFLRKLLGGAEEAAAKLPHDVHAPPLGHATSPRLSSTPARPKPLEAGKPPSLRKPSDLPEPREAKAPHGEVEASATPKPTPTDQFKADAIKRVEKNPKLIQGEPGHRRAPVGEGHEIVEVPDSGLPSGIGCELHSPPPPIKVKCPRPLGNKATEALIEDFKMRGGEIKKLDPGKLPNKSPSEVTAVGEARLPEGFEDLDVPTRTEKQAGVKVGEDHHILTRFRDENKELFEKICFSVDDDFNLITDFKGHGELRGWEKRSPEKKRFIHKERGHNPQYNSWATEKVKTAIKGLRGKSRQAAFQSAVKEIGSIVENIPEILAYGPEVLAGANVLK